MGPWHVKMPHKTCWFYDCCWCWCLETCWGQFVADLEAEVLVIKLNFCSDFEHKVWSRLKLRRDFEAEFWSVFCCWCLDEVVKFNVGRGSEARFGQVFEDSYESRLCLFVICVFVFMSFVILSELIFNSSFSFMLVNRIVYLEAFRVLFLSFRISVFWSFCLSVLFNLSSF